MAVPWLRPTGNRLDVVLLHVSTLRRVDQADAVDDPATDLQRAAPLVPLGSVLLQQIILTRAQGFFRFSFSSDSFYHFIPR